MKKYLSTLFFFLLMIFILGCSNGGGGLTPKDTNDAQTVVIEPDSGIVKLFQTVYMFSNVTTTAANPSEIFSRIGFINVDTSRLKFNGYVQVLIKSNNDDVWVVQNFYVQKGWGEIGAEFYLVPYDPTFNKEIKDIEAFVFITPQPIADIRTINLTKNFLIWKVERRDYNAEGREGSVTQIPDFNAKTLTSLGGEIHDTSVDVNKIFGSVNKNVVEYIDISYLGGTIKAKGCYQKEGYKFNIQAAKNQCGPAGVANSLAWLKDKWGVNVPHEFKKGINGDGSLPGEFDKLMKRTVTDRANGSTVSDGNFIKAKLSYTVNNKICLVNKHQDDSIGDVTETINGHNVTSKSHGKASFEFICEEICKGQDVEIGFSYLPGGHWVKAVGCFVVEINGKLYTGLTYVHDALQADKDPTDTKGLEQETIWVEPTSKKWKNTATGKSVDGMLAAGIGNPTLDLKKRIKGVIDIVVSESPPEAEGTKAKKVCPWIPSIKEKCVGVTHGNNESFINYCFEGNFEPNESITYDLYDANIDPPVNTDSGVYSFTKNENCVCITQRITSYGSYFIKGVYNYEGLTYQITSGAEVGPNEVQCGCP